MQYYPIYLDLRGRLCVVFGGGKGAAEKVRPLLDAGARVRVVAPQLNEELRALGRHFEYVPRAYQPGDLRDVFLAFCEPLDEAGAIFQEAEARSVPVHVQDDAARSSFVAAERPADNRTPRLQDRRPAPTAFVESSPPRVCPTEMDGQRLRPSL